MRPYVFAGGTAVVTGAGSGIGEALTHGLAARGSHLVLVDQHADRLDRVAADVGREHPDVRVRTVVADLADHDATVALGRPARRRAPGDDPAGEQRRDDRRR